MAGSSANPVAPEVVNEHREGWHQFTRFMLAGILSVAMVLIMFALHYAVGWGYALIVMVLGFIAIAIAVVSGKI
jgi:hypothetical protein